MTVTTHKATTSSLLTPAQPYHTTHQVKRQQSYHASLMIWSSLKASLMGGVSLLILMLIGQIPTNDVIPFLSMYMLVVPGFLVVCLATGLLAGVMANDSIRNSYQGGKVGWMAGFWAGIIAGIGAMIMAAAGFYWVEYGQGVAAEMVWLAEYGLSAETVSLAARVFASLLVYGIIGSVVCALLSSIGGMVYPKLGVAD